MSKELNHSLRPVVTYVKWGLLYLVMFGLMLAVFLLVASRIRTYSIPSGSLGLNVPYAKYLVGETVTFTLTNSYNSPMYVANDCPSEPLAVYRFENNTWVRIHDEADVASCVSKDRQITLPAGGQQSGSFAAWKNLFAKPGKYRVVAFVEYFNAMPYQDFEVIAKPEPVSVAQPPTSVQVQPPPSSIAPPTPAPVPVAQTKTISLASGSVTVRYSNGLITVVSVNPASGCRYEGGRSGAQVEITFKCGETETQLQLSLNGSQLVQRVEVGD